MKKQSSSRSKLIKPLAIVAGSLVLVAVLGYFVAVRPQKAHAAQVLKEAVAKEKEVQTRKAELSSSTIPHIRIADLFRVAKAMPDRVAMPDLLLELNQVAQDTGIVFTSITPQPPTVVGAYQAVPIQVLFEGNYYQLSDLLYRLRELVQVDSGALDARGRLFDVQSITFAPAPKGFPDISATLQIQAFVYGTPAPAPGTVPAAATGTDTTSTSTDTTSTTGTTPPTSTGASP